MRTHRQPKCTMCTKHRWLGNASQRFKAKDEQHKKLSKVEMREAMNKKIK